ncbi:tape measure protein [Hydrogenophaga taeniospiralis]|uniref:tape measure protein n=1 Tax=Hydrogenophaga taeniospiralis TaxID=65656 RepID=UPI0021F6222A|nr:tape measure protein [Hydrogenophaga taeniospiralis]MCB4362683.1 tape measure protein [Hydrogenophaga taeniospiralis]
MTTQKVDILITANDQATPSVRDLADGSADAEKNVSDLGASAEQAGQKVDGFGAGAAQADVKVDGLSDAAAGAGEQAQALGKGYEQAADGMSAAAKAATEKTAAIKSALDVERSEIELAKRTLDLQAAQQRGLLQLAQAKGDETAATKAMNGLQQIEVDQLALVARAKRAEAAAVQAATSARRDALSAVGPLTQAQQRELQAADNTAKALRTEAAAADEAARQVRGLGNNLQETADKGPALNTALSAVGKAVAGLFALNKAKDFALDTIALADAYGQMAERIAMATPIADEYDLVQRRILESANLTYRRLDEQQELYIRTADALRGMGFATSDVLDITDSFSYLLTTNAATVERGQNAIDAYTKSIQSGRIEVDAWQSIMAATPTIVNAVAQATGKTADEVRRLGITGKLSINDLNEGLRQTVELNKEAAAGMSATVADAVTRLTNTWTQYIGEANRANQSTEKIVNTINLLTENLDTVVRVATAAGEVMAVVWGVKALGALRLYMAEVAAAATATSAAMAGITSAGEKAALGLKAAGMLAASGWAGWEIGTFLKDEFEVVEQAGIATAAGLSRAAAQYQTAWEMAKAVFTDDTIEAANQRLAERIAQIDDVYADMFANVGKGMPKVANDTKKAGDAAADAAKQIRDFEAAQVEAWEAARVSKVGDTQAAEANLQVQLKLAQQSEQMALFMGDEYEARKAKILQMEIEIQLVNAKVAVQRAEAEGSIAVAQAKLAEMAANKEVNLVKQAELESAIKLAQAKLAEADATGKSTELLQKQLNLFRNGGNAADGYRGSIDGVSGAQARLAQTTDAATAAMQRQRDLYASPLGAGKYGRPEGGSVTGNTREERLAGQNAVDNRLMFELRAKLDAGLLTAADRADIDAVIAALDQNEAVNRDIDRLNPGAFSSAGAADRNEWRQVRTRLAQALGNTTLGGQTGGGGQRGEQFSTPSKTVNVKIDGGRGRRETVNTDDAGAAALVRSLEHAARRS